MFVVQFLLRTSYIVLQQAISPAFFHADNTE
jgi:hypothetical protein